MVSMFKLSIVRYYCALQIVHDVLTPSSYQYNAEEIRINEINEGHGQHERSVLQSIIFGLNGILPTPWNN